MSLRGGGMNSRKKIVKKRNEPVKSATRFGYEIRTCTQFYFEPSACKEKN